jgi:hypothetical protein
MLFFEFEGGGQFIDEDIVTELNTYRIGEVQKGDPNAASLAGYDANAFRSKRFLDGLIISNELFQKLDNTTGFKKFNDSYMWLPIEL